VLHIRIRNGFILLNLLVVILIIAIIFFPSNVLRIVLALPFILFFPGYTLMVAMFPRRERMDVIERIAMSFGISFAIVPLIGLMLNHSPWGIDLETALYSVSSLALFTLSCKFGGNLLSRPMQQIRTLFSWSSLTLRSITSSKIRKSPLTSLCGRSQFSVEKANNVRYCTLCSAKT